MTLRTPRSLQIISLVLMMISMLLSACSSGAASTDHDYPMASMDGMPEEVTNAPLAVVESYQFAVANPEVLTHLPCYCGCGSMGHTSNYACYVSGINPDGSVSYDTHALGCSICVDITQDAMRLLNDGKSLAQIRAYVDETYSKYGPSNMP